MVVQHLNERSGDMTEKFENLDVVRKASGSIIECPSIFSRSGKNLFVVQGNSIRSYNVDTGELVTVYNGLSKNIAGIALNPRDADKLIAVSCTGEFMEWKCSSRGSYIRKCQLDKNSEQYVVKTFSLVLQDDEESLWVVCVAGRTGKNQAIVRTFCPLTGEKRNIFRNLRVDNHNRSLAVRQVDGEILLAGFCNSPKTILTFCVSYNGSETKEVQVFSQNRMTCVACHPTELCVITGDITGCVRVWKDLMRKPVWASYHWHTLPVQALAFSASGSYFYSGGGECVLVRWLLESTREKRILPRLPSEIVYMAVSPGNTYVSVTTMDNGIQLVDSFFNLHNTIQHFSWSSQPSDKKCSLPLQMTTDPRTETLVTNGRVGHLQFVSVDQGSLLFLLDVVGCNYLTQERSKTIKNTEVVKFGFNADGSWLASVECCEDEGNAPQELRLKFWEYNEIKQKYVLNTSVENPHRGAVNAIQFRPSANNESCMCVTTGEDLKFRTWSLEESTHMYRKRHVWTNENVGFYRNLPVGDLSFSSDGSLMAVAFGPTLTVWVPGSNQLKCSLTRPDSEQHISHVKFGHKSCVHLVITGSKLGIAVWNLLSISLLWVVHFNLSVLVSDPLSEVVAAFSDESDVVIFSPNCPDPIFKQNCLMSFEDGRIVNAVFVPRAHQRISNISWQSASELYFLNSKQELFCLEQPTLNLDAEEGRNLDVLPAESLKPKTAYSALRAQQSRTDVTDTRKEHHKHLGIPGFKTLQELLHSPTHSMPPLSLVGHSLLMSFICGTNRRTDDVHSRVQFSDEENEKMDDGDNPVEEMSSAQPSIPSYEKRKQEFMSKNQFTDTPSIADDMGRLIKIQKKPLDWVSELISSN